MDVAQPRADPAEHVGEPGGHGFVRAGAEIERRRERAPPWRRARGRGASLPAASSTEEAITPSTSCSGGSPAATSSAATRSRSVGPDGGALARWCRTRSPTGSRGREGPRRGERAGRRRRRPPEKGVTRAGLMPNARATGNASWRDAVPACVDTDMLHRCSIRCKRSVDARSRRRPNLRLARPAEADCDRITGGRQTCSDQVTSRAARSSPARAPPPALGLAGWPAFAAA